MRCPTCFKCGDYVTADHIRVKGRKFCDDRCVEEYRKENNDNRDYNPEDDHE